MDIIQKIEKAGLVGRGGAAFPTHLKWKSAKQALGSTKYVICNASEGELGVFKDFHILKNYISEVFEGMIIAMDYLGTKVGYFNINANYYRKLKSKFQEEIKLWSEHGYVFNIFQEHPSYIGGEETALLNAIEGKCTEPRLKPPYPTVVGLYGCPTIIQNVETFYDVCLVSKNKYENKRFFSVLGDKVKKGTWHFNKDSTVEEILKGTNNWLSEDFFCQIGGSASGPVFRKDQLHNLKMVGAGSIEVYLFNKDPKQVLKRWFNFYKNESCGKCSPCREGTYQLFDLISSANHLTYSVWKKILDITYTMEKMAFCALGSSISTPVKTYYENVVKFRSLR